jgi:glycosyltransferase involved in cell wall biosynthesis
MRVALLSYNAQPGDAIGNQVGDKLAFFLERGAEVRVFLQMDDAIHPEVRPYYQLVKKPSPRGEAWRYLRSADLVFAEYGQYYALLELLPLLAGGATRVVLDYHGVTPPELWGGNHRDALVKGVRNRGLVWCADAVIVHSHYTENELREHADYPAPRLHRLGFPIDLALFRDGDLGHDWRAALGLESATILLYVGRLAPNKRVPLLVEVLARLRDVTPPVHALIVGPSNDVYQTEAERCGQRAAELGVSERIHLVGPQTGAKLRAAYRAADVFVMPSDWESFCIPVIEAMASGVPVVAARTTVLPETVASAGLTFQPNDAEDLARQLTRILSAGSPLSSLESRVPRVAVVSLRYGDDFAGGEKTSLATIAQALRDAGRGVEVFTTTTRTASRGHNDMPAGTCEVEGVNVHRFRLDPHDEARQGAAAEKIRHANGRVAPATEQEYLECSVRSSALLEALERRRDEFDVFIVGPYLFALTYDVAKRFGPKVLLLPCFHDEPLARLSVWRPVYERVGGILYHSPEEQAWAERELGMNHPGATLLGTYLDCDARGDAARGRAAVGGAQPYVVYCGRYSQHKELPRVVEFARRYDQEHPGRFRFVFLGEGEVAIPRESWARDLGFVGEACKRDVLAGAAALVQLSRNESLSLVALEAWAQDTPVIASARSAVLAGHIQRSGGGWCVENYEQFADVLQRLHDHPERGDESGRRGQEYVRRTYGSRGEFTARLLEAIASLARPLRDLMRQRGLERATLFDRAVWRSRFAGLIDALMDREPMPFRERIEVRPRHDEHSARADAGTLLVPVRVTNQGTHALVADGPGRTLLHGAVHGDRTSQPSSVPLPHLLVPGRSVSAVVPVAVPARAGAYRALLWAGRHDTEPATEPEAWCRLVVHDKSAERSGAWAAPLLDEARAALAQAHRLRELPDTYTDVTEGWFATWKRWLKRKLLGNFKHAYVDVLSHQQTAFNQQVLRSVDELTECCATLDHAVRVLQRQVTRRRRRRLRLGARGER